MINLFKFIIGSVLGSFITLSTVRIFRHESIVFPESHCDQCNHQLRAWELIPILSFILLRGRCHYCHHSIDSLTFIGESLGGLILLFNLVSIPGILEAIFEFLLLFIAECDREHYLIFSWSLLSLLGIAISQLSIAHQFDLKRLLLITIVYAIASLINHQYQFIGNGDIDILFILFIKLNLRLTLIIITISSLLAIVKYGINHSSRLIPYVPYLAVTYFLLSWI